MADNVEGSVGGNIQNVAEQTSDCIDPMVQGSGPRFITHPTPSEMAEYEDEFGDMEREMAKAREVERAIQEGRDVLGPGVDPDTSMVNSMLERGERGRFTSSKGTRSRRRASEALQETSEGDSPGGGDDAWLVMKPVLGGPAVPNVIPSFGGHVACSLWEHPSVDRGVLRVQSRARAVDNLKNWKLSNIVLQLVQASGLGHLHGCTLKHLNLPLLCAFVERWQPDTNTFHLPFGEMTILLHDVAEIMGVTIEGLPCKPLPGDLMSGVDGIVELMRLTKTELLGRYFNNLTETYAKGGVLVEALRRRLAGGSFETSVEAQGYLLYSLGCSLFVDKTGDRCSGTLYQLLRQVEKVSGFAWGVGALAYLYRQLGVATRMSSSGLSGCLTLLQTWIYEYFPLLRPSEGLINEIKDGEPRSLRWIEFGTPTTAGLEALRTYRRRLDRLTPADVLWCPYGVRAVYP